MLPQLGGHGPRALRKAVQFAAEADNPTKLLMELPGCLKDRIARERFHLGQELVQLLWCLQDSQ